MEQCLEDGTIQTREPRQPGQEANPIGDTAATRKGFDDSLVLPQSLSEKRGSLQEPPAGLDFCKYDIVVVDRHNACNKEPATKEAFAGPPRVGEIVDAQREGHAQKRTKLTVDTTGTYDVAPKDFGFCRQA